MADMTITIPVKEDMQDGFADLCQDLGVNMVSVFEAFVKAAVQKKRLPGELEVAPDPFYSPENIAELKKRAADVEAGKFTYHELIEVEDEEGLA
ncbi:MAG: type II toxin-antitoxin system antitoxin, RelB/DinJ family [Defluviitaleaceae bacterium]|nr:type II toxin-antitoxin system antitoxin, RelB/DinJ family [Defluviitaleaceae bacterium]